jgi:hypothetical protein
MKSAFPALSTRRFPSVEFTLQASRAEGLLLGVS